MSRYITSLIVIALGLGACRSVTVNTDGYPTEITLGREKPLDGVAALPPARVYRTNGDWNDLVPITLNFMRTVIVSYPAPTDISASVAPVPLADGWLLDRRGVGRDTAFTSYTYADYEALPQVPTTDDLWRSIVKGARVTEVVELPMTLSAAVADTAACNRLISEGFPGCRLVYRMSDIIN